MKRARKRSRYRAVGLKAAFVFTAILAGGNCADAGVVTTVDPGAVGSTSPTFTATVTLADPTIDSVEILFEDMKFLEVTDNHLIFTMRLFGSPPEGGNSRSTRVWGFLDELGDSTFTASESGVIATEIDSLGTPVPGTFRVYGFFATWDPPVFVRAGTSQVEFTFNAGEVLVGGPTEVTPVGIDIKPGNKHNNVNPHSGGRIWVAILSDVSPESPFDPLSQIDIPTVGFGPDTAKVIHHEARDVNRDGLNDLLLQFNVRQTGIACGETEATLAGQTFDGGQFSGTDSIDTVGCKSAFFQRKTQDQASRLEPVS